MSTNIAPRRCALLMWSSSCPRALVLADAEPAAPYPATPCYRTSWPWWIKPPVRRRPAATHTALLTLAKKARAAADAKTVDPIFAVRYSRLLSASGRAARGPGPALLADVPRVDDGLHRGAHRAPAGLEHAALRVGDHGGSGVGLALLVEPSCRRSSACTSISRAWTGAAILESYMKARRNRPDRRQRAGRRCAARGVRATARA